MRELLEESERVVAKIVAKLAANGVCPTTLDPIDYFSSLEEINGPMFEDAILWLGQEGIIRHGDFIEDVDEGFSHCMDCVLTSYGFKVLERDFDGGKTKLSTTIKSISKEDGRGYTNTGQLIGGTLGAFTKSMGHQ